ncbi:MAG: ubiquinone-binding protein [Gammaproteobacteria bacterium RIFCSPHIGHO2_12_FULL_41_15]|nr:MAG: ubiquinone-binding protein [Gammaproteobacteria bacterium RIFCSPHIGHO2_12_FULL_41_15]
MSIIKKMATVPHTIEQMYQLVDEIQYYPEFVPWCKDVKIFKRTDDEVRASLTFVKGAMKKSFTTSNRLQPHKMIEIRLVNGPFKRLEGFWQFETVADNHCQVTLFLDFEFSSGLMASFFSPLFHSVANRLVDTFCQRAKKIYGDHS